MSDELQQLNTIRLEEDLTYGELAAAIGIHASALHRLLNTERPALDRTMHKIRKYLANRIVHRDAPRGGHDTTRRPQKPRKRRGEGSREAAA